MKTKEKDKKETRAPRMKKQDLQEKILAFLQKEKRQAFNYKQIAFGVGATHPANRNDVINLLDEMAATEQILEVDLGRYKANTNQAPESIGIFVRRSNGKNGVTIDDNIIMVAERNSMHALNGD
ncbi:MAG: ribonuclease R, partial [Muribaculaceae bacterium]|nr:ribonuclease R [Muribaculaceae bacterium]